MITFSLACPTSLQIRPGAHPVKVSRSISGTSKTRLMGSQPVGATLRAGFSCSSAQAAQVMADYHATYSGAQPVDLPSELFTGHTEVEAALPAGLRWFMAEPEISPVRGGRCTVSVEFEGRLEV